MPQLSISLLGPFQVSLDNQPVTAFRSDKERALLAYLAIEADRPHRREALAALLWGELPEEAALNNVRKALHRLRQVLQDDGAETPFLITTPKTIQFNRASHYELDTASFTRSLVQTQTHRHRRISACQTCHAALEAAASRYRGDLLHGFTLPDCMAFDEWLLIAREQLRLNALDVFHNLASYYERRGLLDRVQYYALRLLELDPLREEAHRQIMLALTRAGQRAAALARYETCRRLLANELAVEPE
jgi:DNA-binding SARP family transcriptional activator